jgi:hypothetical protein
VLAHILLAIFFLYNINSLAFYNWRAECLQRGTDWILL